MTPDLAAIRARAAAALNPAARFSRSVRLPDSGNPLARFTEEEWQFYLAARTDVPSLCDAVEAQAAEIVRLRASLAALIRRVDAVGNWGSLNPVYDTDRALLSDPSAARAAGSE